MASAVLRTQLEQVDPDHLNPKKQRSRILRPDPLHPHPRTRDVASIEVEMRERIERGRVLEVETGFRLGRFTVDSSSLSVSESISWFPARWIIVM